MRPLISSHGLTSYMAEEDGKTVLGSTQDVEPILEHCARLRSEGVQSKEMPMVASFPENIVLIYMNTHGIDFEEFMVNPVHVRRMCADPDLAHFRTH